MKVEDGVLYDVLPEDIDDFGEFQWPEGVTEIGYEAFKELKNLRKITFPDSIARIGKGSFSQCYALERIKIPGHVQTIGEYAFAWSGLKAIEISEGVKEIGDSAFAYCRIESIEFPPQIQIERRAFSCCQKLRYIKLRENTKVSIDVFLGCSDLKEVWIDNSVNFLNLNPFTGCDSLKYVHYGEKCVDLT